MIFFTSRDIPHPVVAAEIAGFVPVTISDQCVPSTEICNFIVSAVTDIFLVEEIIAAGRTAFP